MMGLSRILESGGLRERKRFSKAYTPPVMFPSSKRYAVI